MTVVALVIVGSSNDLFLDHDEGVQTSGSTGDTGLKQTLLLVEVDIELGAMNNLATLGLTKRIVSEITDNGKQTIGLVADSTGLVGELGNSIHVSNIERGGKLVLVAVKTTAIQILRKDELVKELQELLGD